MKNGVTRKLSFVFKKTNTRELTIQRINRTIRPCADGCEGQGLMSAIDRCHRSCVMKLLSAGEDPYDENENGEMAFHRSVRNPDILEMFLEFGCDVGVRTSRPELVCRDHTNVCRPAGRTALHFAAEAGQIESVKLLLEYGADPDPADDLHLTPLVIALAKQQIDCAKFLLKANLYYNEDGQKWLLKTLMTATYLGDVELMKLLIDAGAHPFGADIYDGFTPLMMAAKSGQLPAIRLLLECGVDPNCRDKLRRWKASDYAHASGHDDLVIILKEYEDSPSKVRARNPSARPRHDRVIKADVEPFSDIPDNTSNGSCDVEVSHSTHV